MADCADALDWRATETRNVERQSRKGANVTAPDYRPATTGNQLSVAPAQAQAPSAVVPAASQVYGIPVPTVHVHVNTPAMPMILAAPAGPPFLVRALWYLFVGWWLSAVMIVLGYLLMMSVIGIPVAFAVFNRIPQVLTLRARTVQYRADIHDGITYLTAGTERQRPWLLRAVYFLLIGWWFGAAWLVAAWLIGLLLITLPISFLMYNRTSGVMTLQRH